MRPEETIFDEPVYALVTHFGNHNPRTSPRADNDNNPDRVTRMVPFNGGCSTTSGKTPVTLPRLGCLGQGIDPIKISADGIDGVALQVAA